MKRKNVVESFAERLIDLMQSQSLNMKELSKLIGIPRSTINGWTLKQRTANIDSLCVIADFFGVTTDYLLGREE